MASKLFAIACILKDTNRNLSPRPRYPSMPKYPKGVVDADKKGLEGLEAKVTLAVSGMVCAACAGSIEKAIKRLPGTREAAVDIINGRVLVMFYRDFVDVRDGKKEKDRGQASEMILIDNDHP